MAEEACVQKRKGREEKKCTSDSGSLSKMGQVIDVSSLCLDCKKRGEHKTRLKKKKKKKVSEVSHKKVKKYFRGNLLSAQQQDEELSFSCCLVFCWQEKHL